MRFTELEESDMAYFTEIYFNKELLWDTRLATLSEKFKCSTHVVQILNLVIIAYTIGIFPAYICLLLYL